MVTDVYTRASDGYGCGDSWILVDLLLARHDSYINSFGSDFRFIKCFITITLFIVYFIHSSFISVHSLLVIFTYPMGDTIMIEQVMSLIKYCYGERGDAKGMWEYEKRRRERGEGRGERRERG